MNDHAKAIRGSRIVILGVSYKAGVGDLRESPALKVMKLLRERGADLSYCDSYVPSLPDFDLEAEEVTEALDAADAAVILTAHPDLDVEDVALRAPLVVDFRGVTRNIEAAHVVRL